MGKFLYQRPVRPAILIQPLQLIVSRETQHLAYTDMHKVLFLFLGENFGAVAELLNPDKEQDTIQVFGAFAYNVLEIAHEGTPLTFKFEVAFKHDSIPPSIQIPGANAELQWYLQQGWQVPSPRVPVRC